MIEGPRFTFQIANIILRLRADSDQISTDSSPREQLLLTMDTSSSSFSASVNAHPIHLCWNRLSGSIGLLKTCRN